MQLSDVIKQCKSYNKETNTSLLKKAYKFAEEQHKGQKRKTGEAYIQHPLQVAYLLAKLELDDTTIAAALLHDVVEDTETTKEDIEDLFGEEVAFLVEGMTKIKKFKSMSKEEYYAKKTQQVLLASVKDIRIILIKLADRTHNMRTIKVFREEKRKRIAKDALEIYAPIAHKLGIASLKWELENLAFEQLHPKEYKEIVQSIKRSRKQREREINKIKHLLKKKINGNNFLIQGRPKHIYSIYRKMQKKNVSFEEIYDLAALRVITKAVPQCYEVLGIVHSLWKPLPKEFDDYIAMPKSNGYQSLHTAVLGPSNSPVEIQIRTEEMHIISEKGIAAHWAYKGHKGTKKFDQKLKWMMELSELQKNSESAKDFLKMLHIDLFGEDMFTFTPKGRVIELPRGSTILDFAYAVHSELGDRCIAAKVNSKFVPLRAKLENGDLVEILTSKNQHPSRDWLKIVHTSKAAGRIKRYIRLTQNMPVKSFAKEKETKKKLAEWIIHIENMTKPDIRLAKCCKPLPGEKITGFATKAGKVMVHKKECKATRKKILGLSRKKVKALWLDNIGSFVELKVDAKERTGLFPEILNTLISLKAPLQSAKAKPMTGEMIECSFEMETSGIAHLENIIKRIKRIQGVKEVFIGKISN